MSHSDRLITAREAAPYVCGYGLKEFCRANGLSYFVFLNPGYAASVLRATGDQVALDVLDRIETEGHPGGQQ